MTPSVLASLKFTCEIEDDGYLNMFILTCYLGWVGYSLHFIHSIGKVVKVMHGKNMQ